MGTCTSWTLPVCRKLLSLCFILSYVKHVWKLIKQRVYSCCHDCDIAMGKGICSANQKLDSRLCVMQLNSLKRYLRLQSLPSLQEAYALPDSPHHMATITGSLLKMQLAPPSPSAAHLPQTHFQHSAAASPVLHSPPHGGLHSPMQRRRAHTSLGFSSAEGAASLDGQPRAATAVGGARGRSTKRGWDDSGVQLMQRRLSSSIGSDEEERYWEEQARLQLAAQQQETCKTHLAW